MSEAISAGKYIVLEGGEYVGKSTQVQILAKTIGGLAVREPGGTKAGELIRAILIDPDTPTSPMTDTLLNAAQRAELMVSVVEPTLRSGKHVVSDRSWISGCAYQGAQGVSIDDIRSVNQTAIGSRLQPDLLIVLDADPRDVAQRAGTTKDYYERMDSDFHQKVRDNFLTLGEQLGGIVIDATGSQELVSEQILEAVIQSGVLR